VVAVVLVFTGLLAGCRSAPDNPRLDWVPTARCPDPSTVGASSELGSIHFTVTTAKSETLRSTGCSYRDSADGIRVDATIEPGPPSDVQFGTAAGIVDSKKPALGNGAHLGISPTYCSVAVPKTHSGTIQLEIIAGAAASRVEAHACASLVRLLNEFADQGRND